MKITADLCIGGFSFDFPKKMRSNYDLADDLCVSNFDLSVDLQIRNGNPQICRGEQCSPENKGLLFVLDGRSMIAPTVFAEFPSFFAQT